MFLGQAERSGAKIDNIGGTRAKRGWVMRLAMGLVPPMLIWALMAHFSTSSSQVSSYVKIFTPEKS
jgi:hypothetical protein